MATTGDTEAVEVKVPRADVFDEELGVSSSLPFSIPYKVIDGVPTVELLRSGSDDEGPTVRQLVSMRRSDGQARALYRLLTLPLRAAFRTATIKAADGGDTEGKFIDDMLFTPPAGGGMTVPFSRVIAQIMTAFFNGFAAFEMVYTVPKDGPFKGKIIPKKIAYRPADTITFLADRNGSYAGVRQRANFQGHVIDVGIPASRSYYFSVQEEERLFYGVSLFQSAFYHYDMKKKLYYIAHLAAQRHAVGTRVGNAPLSATKQDKNNFSKALANMGVAQYIALPGPDWKVASLTEGGTFDFLSFVNHHNSQMSKSVLAGFMDSSQGGGSSDTSLVNFGESNDSMFLLMLRTLMDDIAMSINNYIIPRFVTWNFGTDKFPKFVWGQLTEEQKNAVKDTFDRLATAGQNLTVTPEFVYELEKQMATELELDVDYKAVDERKAKEKADAEQQAKDQADQQKATQDQQKAMQDQQFVLDQLTALGQGSASGPPQSQGNGSPQVKQPANGAPTATNPVRKQIENKMKGNLSTAPKPKGTPVKGGKPISLSDSSTDDVIRFTARLLEEIVNGEGDDLDGTE